MKMGILSLLIGIIGLVLITYYNHQANIKLQELWELGEVIRLYTMSSFTRVTLFLSETAGVALGIVSFRRSKSKIGLFGMGVCALNLILLFAQF